jgi:hypothetical protein
MPSKPKRQRTVRTPWQNRIVGDGVADPAKLQANPRNWRYHGQRQQDALDGMLSGVGQADTTQIDA